MRKKQDKQHRFYTNEHRNERWTEEPKGRPIDFADKYTEDGAGSNKYSDERRARQYKAKRKKENRIKAIKASLACVLTVVLRIYGNGYSYDKTGKACRDAYSKWLIAGQCNCTDEHRNVRRNGTVNKP